ncbi:MAG: hypothetical protein Q4G60_12340 [bacterium]|nr:hypothetical protein [bacterium]
MKLEEIIGASVIHSSYGRGIILECVKNHIVIEFAHVNKTFLYPEGFIKYLIFADQEMQEEMQSYLTIWKIESGYAAREELWKQHQKIENDMIARRKAVEEKKRLAAERVMANRANSNFGQSPNRKGKVMRNETN